MIALKAIVNVRIYDYIDYIDDGYLLFDKEIIEMGPMKNFKQTCERIDGKGRLVIPGLINFHTHVYSALFRGLNLNASPVLFREILEDIWWRFDAALKLEDVGFSAGVYCKDSLQSGVTAIVDHHASGEISGSLAVLRNVIKGHFGMKALFCFETSDRFNLDLCISENVEAIEMGDGLFGLHAQMSLSESTLSACSPYAKGTPIHIHVAESKEDEANCIEKHGQRVVQRLDAHSLLTRHSILAHCVHIDEEEAEIIGKRGCVVALNPSSNMNNAVGYFNYDFFRNNSIDVVAGTDGLGSNIAKEWQNIFFNGKQFMNHPSGISPDEIRCHLVRSYELFNELANVKIGRFKTGYDADFLITDYIPPTEMNEDNAFAHVFFGAFDHLRPKDVFIKGELKIENYELTIKFDFNHDIPNQLWKRIEG